MVNSTEIAADRIELKYFEPGHTYMSADHFHHQVEESLKQAGNFSDFQDCVQSANKGRVHVKAMEFMDFTHWPDVSSMYKINKINPRPYIADFAMVIATRGQRVLTYKTEFGGEGIELNFLTAAAHKSGVQKPAAKVSPRGIPQIKRDDITSKLGALMPASRRKFWSDIPISDAVDLVTSDD